ncbi:MAG: ABC transporter substrate-binding protein [Eubacteriales bacterium]
MKKLLALTLSASVLLTALVGCSTTPPDTSSTGTTTGTTSTPSTDTTTGGGVLKIGVFEPTTGENGGGGQLEVNGVEYANQVRPEVTVGGETYTVELVLSDNKSDKSEAVTAANYLVNQGVTAVVGSYGSAVAIAAGSVFQEALIPAIGASCTNPQVTLGNDYYFRVCFLDSFQASVLASYSISAGYEKAAILTQIGDDYSIGLGSFFKDSYTALGGEVVSDQQFPANNPDYSALLQNIKSSGAQVVFSPCSITAAPVILQQAQALGLDVVFIGPDTWDNAEMIATAEAGAPGCAEGVVVSTFFDDSASDVADFVNGYKTAFSTDTINVVTALGYDAYMAALDAIEAADSVDSAAVRDALTSVSMTGVTGPIAFDENGDVSKDSAVLKAVTDGTLTYFDTITMTDIG